MSTGLATSTLVYGCCLLIHKEKNHIFLFLENRLHVSWSDSSFLQYLNPTTVLDYFCDPRNPFYDSNCNNQILKMQGFTIFSIFIIL